MKEGKEGGSHGGSFHDFKCFYLYFTFPAKKTLANKNVGAGIQELNVCKQSKIRIQKRNVTEWVSKWQVSYIEVFNTQEK